MECHLSQDSRPPLPPPPHSFTGGSIVHFVYFVCWTKSVDPKSVVPRGGGGGGLENCKPSLQQTLAFYDRLFV